MENIYDDEMLPENFEIIAKAYSKSLKEKGFVFINLQEEEFSMLLDEVYVLIAKMKACLKKLSKHMESGKLMETLNSAVQLLYQQFGRKKEPEFSCVQDENMTFLSLVALENTLILKLLLLASKSEQLELCTKIVTAISGIFAESFSCDGFKLL